jgi:hypothetical protein
MSSGSGRTLVTRINKQNEDKGNRNRKNKFGDNRRTARNMAAVAIPSTYIITERFWSWDTQRQEYKKHVSLPQGPTMQLVSVPEKPSTHGFSFARAYRCILHKHMTFARRVVVIQRCLQLPTTLRQLIGAAIHIILSSLHTDFATDWTARVSNSGRSTKVFCSPSIMKRSEGLNNRVFIITGRYITQIKRSSLLIWLFRLSHFFTFFWFYFVSLYIWLYVFYASV